MVADPLSENLAPEYLTAALRRAGALRAGRVIEVTVETSRPTIVSTIVRLRVRYAGDDSGPAHVLLKTPRHDVPAELADSGCLEPDVYAVSRRDKTAALRRAARSALKWPGKC
jgi:hypothetical protein